MKKFCSKCGSQLDLGKKTCVTCQAFNPYYIAGFKAEQRVLQQADASMIPETSVNDQLQHEFELKNELQRVKEEAAQYKTETISLVTEVRKELNSIEHENRLLKEKVDSLELASQNHPTGGSTPAAAKVEANGRKSVTAMAAVIMLLVVTAASFVFFNHFNKKPAEPAAMQTTTPAQPAGASTVGNNTNPVHAVDKTAKNKLLAVANPAAPKPLLASTGNTAAPAKTETKPASSASPGKFTLTEARLKTDLVGKKLSGCDITIGSAAEISSISNIAMVDKLSAIYVKYKCSLKVKQGSEEYNSSPYIYYSSSGTFIKVDGTTCE